METSNLLDTGFKTLVIKILNELSETFSKMTLSIKKDIKTIKKKWSKI